MGRVSGSAGVEGYYEKGPVDFRTETLSVLNTIGDAVPARIELGYHLCYGSPADEHCVQPKDAGIMVEMTNAIAAGVKRPIQFFHLPVPKGRTDDAYYVPLEALKLGPETELYLGSHPPRRCRGRRHAASRSRGVTRASTASPPSVAWRAHACPVCSPHTPAPPKSHPRRVSVSGRLIHGFRSSDFRTMGYPLTSCS